MSANHDARREREDRRNEAAALAKHLERHEAEVRRRERAREWRRLQPIFMTAGDRFDETGFAPGCTL